MRPLVNHRQANFEGLRGVGGAKMAVAICFYRLPRRHLELEALHERGEEDEELRARQRLPNTHTRACVT